MRVEIQRPDILRVTYLPDPEEKEYPGCTWARFDFDQGSGMLNIQSDCGNYGYRWCETGCSFMELMVYVGEEYLIHKLCGNPDKVNIEATLKEAREWVLLEEEEEIAERLEAGEKEADIVYALYAEDSADEGIEAVYAVKEKLMALRDLKYALGKYGSEIETGVCQKIISDWNDENNLDLDDVWELPQMEYTAQQKRIVRIFTEYIQPKIRKYLKEDGHGRAGTMDA